MNNKWNLFCQQYDKNQKSKEEVVQSVFEAMFSELFGYSRLNSEIDSHRVLHIGSTDRVIPDIIIRDPSIDRDLFIVELKRLNMTFSDDYREQLFSYMRLLSVNVGILVCDAIYIYVLNNTDYIYAKLTPEEDKPAGTEFFKLFSKGGFDIDSIRDFICNLGNPSGNVNQIIEEVTELNIKELIKGYLSAKYSEPEIDEALEKFKFITELLVTPPPQNKELIQDWVKRIFNYMFTKNLLSDFELKNLHELYYSKITFGIKYPLLIDSNTGIVVKGHNRYWLKKIGKYYVCSQWWKQDDANYEINIRKWLKRVLPDYVDRGLDRIKK